MAIGSAPLSSLASLLGIQTRYRALDGRVRQASTEALMAVARALGLPIERPEEAPALGRALAEKQSAGLIPPVTVAAEGAPLFIEFSLPRRSSAASCSAAVFLESQEERGATLALLPAATPGHLPGLRGARARWPQPLPAGFHRLVVQLGRRTAEGLLLVAPRRAYAAPAEQMGPRWGLFAPLYSLRAGGPVPAGSFAQLPALAALAAERGGSLAATLPLHAAFLDEPFDPSPYAPVSRLFLNEYYLDLAALPEWAASEEARALVDSPAFREEADRLRSAGNVHYRRSSALKRRAIEVCVRGLMATAGPRRARFERFLREEPELSAYAAFRAITERRREGWPAWEERLRCGAWRDEDYDRSAFLAHAYAQFAAREQMEEAHDGARKRGVGLYLDYPLGVHPEGFDTWRHQGLFARGVSAGAPPDPFFSGGQDWGFPPLHPAALQSEEGIAYLRASISAAMRHADLLRIDHVMGLHRLFWVPSGFPAREGLYVRYPAGLLYGLVCLESRRHGTEIVGEDLGTVPAEVRRTMAGRGLRRMWVFPFETSASSPPPSEAVPPGALAALNTHDMPPFASYWRGLDVQDRLELGLLDPEGARREGEERRAIRENVARQLGISAGTDDAQTRAALLALLRELGGSRARFLVVSLEDLWGETVPQNWPGVTGARPNWSRFLRYSLEESAARPDVAEALELLKTAASRGESMEKSDKTQPEGRGLPPADSLSLTEEDRYLFNEGSHTRLYRRLGAHPCEREGKGGVHFAVWAPNAEAVSVIGDFNRWAPGSHPLTPSGSSGLWEGFVEGARKGDRYKFHIDSRVNGYKVDKADPFALWAETPPRTASIVWDLDYAWNDGGWMAERAQRQTLEAPVSIYEVHLGSWARVPEEGGRSLGYRELAPKLAAYVKEAGFTHVELMPVMEHPFYGSWGYQCTGYFAPTSRYGTPQDLMALIDTLHQQGIGVILDWVPSHFPTDEHGLGFFDGTHLFEHEDPRRGFHPDWGSAIFNYGRHEVRSFLLSSAFFWLECYHADGIRVDAVASMLYLDYSRKEGEWEPNAFGGRENLEAIDFLKRLNTEIYAAFPDVQTWAEESTAWPMASRPTYAGGLGFGLKWDMGWMHDTLEYFRRDPIHRRYHHGELTFRALYAFTENFVLPLSHDEVVHGKGSLLGRMPGDDWQRFANLRALLATQFAQPGKKLLFMGGEIGQWREWSHDGSLDWHLLEYSPHKGLQAMVRDLNGLYRREPALHAGDCRPEGFSWVDCNDAESSVLLFERRTADGSGTILVACNYTPVPRYGYRAGVAVPGRWIEFFNSDAAEYGGSGLGNGGAAEALPEPAHGRPFSLGLTLPPLAVLFLKPEKR